jgi:hypothetical protein
MKPTITRRYTIRQLDEAMGVCWDERVVQDLFQRLRDRFPRHHKSLARIEEWVGDNSNERSDIETHSGGSEDKYSHAWNKVMNAVDRLPWDRFGG